MNPTLKAAAVVVFVAALSAVLVRPILTAYDAQNSQGPSLPVDEAPASPDEEAEGSASPALTMETSTPEPEPSLEPGITVVDNPVTFAHPYPRRCLRSVPSASGGGTIAAYEGGRVSLAAPDGDVVARIKARPPLQWSAGGDFLGTAGARLWRSDGSSAGAALGLCSNDGCRSLEQWGWSTAGDCVVGIAEGGLYAGGPGLKTRVLIERGVRSFSFSPNGKKLAALLISEADPPVTTVVRADLRRGELGSTIVPDGSGATTLAGWSTDGRDVLVWTDPSSRSGRGLVGLTREGSSLPYTAPPHVVVAFDPVSAMTPCGDSSLAVLSVDNLRSSKARLAFIDRGDGPRFVTPVERYRQVTCSPTGAFIVASLGSRKRTRLVVLSREGESLQELSSGFSLSYPTWGRGGTGVLYVRTDSGDDFRRLWFIPEGGTARATALSLTREDACGLEGLFDWNADRPLGFAAGYNQLCVSASL